MKSFAAHMSILYSVAPIALIHGTAEQPYSTLTHKMAQLLESLNTESQFVPISGGSLRGIEVDYVGIDILDHIRV